MGLSLKKTLVVGSFVLLLFFPVGCQKKVYLMPTPALLQSGEHDPFAVNPDQDQTNRVMVAYATNRMGVGPQDDRKYMTLFDKNIRLGTTRVRIGSDKKTWMELHGLSTINQRQGNILLDLESTDELAQIYSEEPIDELGPEARLFFEKLNQALEQCLDKDLILYIHGANNNFYRSSAQAAQFRHFTGRNSVVMFFAWPSAASLLRYAVDVNNARRSVSVFARLLELLAKYSSARHIDILAYSAGAQVLNPALLELMRKYRDEDIEKLKKRLRLGEIYFAAPDVDFRAFLENLAVYINLPEHITLAVNPDDSVLKLAARHHKVSRAGRPDPGELTAEETRWIIEATRKMPLDILWITSETIRDMDKGSHSFWYSNPWVSTDVLVLFLLQGRPSERGLAEYEGDQGGRIWYFPENYPEEVDRAIKLLRTETFQ